MNLSEAIRLSIGAVREYRMIFLAEYSHRPCGCALGTAGYSIGLRNMTLEDDPRMLKAFPILSQCVICPVHRDGLLPLHHVISRLHCGVKWSREAIAEFVESIELKTTIEPYEVAPQPVGAGNAQEAGR